MTLSQADLEFFSKETKVTLGEQFSKFLIEHGYLDGDGKELLSWLGGKESEGVKENRWCREFYGDSFTGYIAVENDGFGNFYLVDSNDDMYFLNHENGQVARLDKKFNEHYNKLLNEDDWE